jgi:hypothetical protein
MSGTKITTMMTAWMSAAAAGVIWWARQSGSAKATR